MNMCSKLIVFILLYNVAKADDYTGKIKLVLFKSSYNDRVSIPIENCEMLLQQPEYNSTKGTVFYIHGYNEKLTDPTQRAIVDAYVKNNEWNLVIVDWTSLDTGNYILTVLPRLASVASKLVLAIENLANKGMDTSNFQLIGHSLGAQISGMVGRNLKFKLPRIIGLDPAKPGFYTFGFYPNLKSGDANYVLCVSSDSGMYGTLEHVCDGNFIINNGIRFQPGCPMLVIPFSMTRDELCSHQRSVYVWAESVNCPMSVIGVKCSSAMLFYFGLCSNNQKEEMGTTLAHGKFYTKTRRVPSYALN